jgi:hypothetical protein
VRDKYDQQSVRQNTALNALAERASGVREWLFSAATYNAAFIAEMGKFVADLAGKLARAAIEASAVVTAPWAVSTAAGFVGDITTQVLNLIPNAITAFVNDAGLITELTEERDDRRAFPDGKWPLAASRS